MGEEIDVESRTITMHLETRGSRKALGAINAKLRAKVGRLERDLSAALTTAECADNYAKMFEECAEERDQHAQRIGELEGLLRHAQKQVPTGSGLHMRIDAALSAGKEGE